LDAILFWYRDPVIKIWLYTYMEFINLFQLMDIVKYLRREKEILTTKVKINCIYSEHMNTRQVWFLIRLNQNVNTRLSNIQKLDRLSSHDLKTGQIIRLT
jgi:molybdenum cofactor biosynthesis enzyme MoaA